VHELQDFLVSEDFLDEFRFDMRRLSRTHLPGEHLTRRLGQSLDFHEHRRFSFGDDVRHIDWRVSSRAPHRLAEWERWHIRRFVAEEHMKIMISIDARATMIYPQVPRRGFFASRSTLNGSKIQAAYWMAQAISFIALSSRDKVTLHRLFGTEIDPIQLRIDATVPDIAQDALTIIGAEAQPEILRIDDLDRCLSPTAVWLILTDLYFHAAPNRLGESWYALVERIHQARRDHIWTILVDLNSWPTEAAYLRHGGNQKEVDGPQASRVTVLVDAALSDARSHIEHIKQEFREAASYTEWEWPPDSRALADSDAMQHFCQNKLLGDREIQRLFMREE
jgi:hypothetical protein